ncbi:MAG: AAA family ATPase [Treponema sp.]|nr:AAA family ATPase [Treponema sp.]
MDFRKKLPVGIQDFEKLKEEGCVLIDSTELMMRLVRDGNAYMLCRPRYFGKSLLVSQLASYFRGRRDLFEGLAAEGIEKEWIEYSVITLDFSSGVYSSEGKLSSAVDYMLRGLEQTYRISDAASSFSDRFSGIIRAAYQKSGRPVVVLVDDFDKPILDAVFTPQETENREILRELYGALSGNDFYLKFVFFAGISKFSSVNIFNGTLQLKDISENPVYGTLCGFTAADVQSIIAEAEIPESSDPDQSLDAEKIFDVVDRWYGGYRFSAGGEVVYNPYSVMCCLDFNSPSAFLSGEIRHQFWIQTGQPTMLVRMLLKNKWDLFNMLYGLKVDREELMEYQWTENDMLSLVYQAGYLTCGEGEGRLVQLSMPNAEVVEGMLKAMLCRFTSIGGISRSGTELESMRSFLASRNVGGFISKFEQAIQSLPLIKEDRVECEYVFKMAFHVIANLIGTGVTSDSNSDVMLRVKDGEGKSTGYIFELKADKGVALAEVAADAFLSIESRGYEEVFTKDEIECRKVCIVFSSDGSGIAGWMSK